MKVFIGSDHGAYDMKEILKEELEKLNIEFEDCWCFSTDSVDYPNIAKTTCDKVLKTPESLGVLLCGTGIGISIAANKIKDIRAALCHNEFTAKMSRNHNNANILCMWWRVIGSEVAKAILSVFLSEKFEWGRHERRVGLIDKLQCCTFN